MRDSRRQREITAVFIVAGLAAVFTHYLSPAVNRKVRKR